MVSIKYMDMMKHIKLFFRGMTNMEEKYEEVPMISYEDMIKHISEKHNIPEDTVQTVLDAEAGYLMELGIIETE